MERLYTTKQLEEFLKVDRITIYRMLSDKRLNGVKVGGQWRFTQNEIDRLLGDEKVAEDAAISSVSDFPTGCMQDIQEMFTGIIGIGAITVTLHGTLLTQPSFSSPFCQMMLSSEKGAEACKRSWLEIISSPNTDFHTCHAGLCYRRSAIFSNDTPIAWLIAGQFYLNSPDVEKRTKKIGELAEKYEISTKELVDASKGIPVLNDYQKKQVQDWTPKVAENVESLICERSQLINRLKLISELSSLKTNPTE